MNQIDGLPKTRLLNETLTPQQMEPAKCAMQAHQSTAKNTVWRYPTTIRPEAVSQIREALSLNLPGTHKAHQPGALTSYSTFPTAAGMVPQKNTPSPHRAVKAMAHREGAPLDWTPNTLVEQRVHQNTKRDAKYTRCYETKKAIVSPTARRWCRSSRRTRAQTVKAWKCHASTI